MVVTSADIQDPVQLAGCDHFQSTIGVELHFGWTVTEPCGLCSQCANTSMTALSSATMQTHGVVTSKLSDSQ